MSNETYWDSIQIIKDPKKKEIAASFVQTDEGAAAGSESPCVRILAPDDYFPYKDNSGHYYIAYIYEPLPVDIVGTVTHTTGGICEANSIVVPTEMNATSTFTIPRGSTEVRVDLTLNQVLVDVSQTPDYKAAYTATLTSVTNGQVCGEAQCIKFWAGTSVIPDEPDPGPEPDPETEVPPDDDQFPECDGPDCSAYSAYQTSVTGNGSGVIIYRTATDPTFNDNSVAAFDLYEGEGGIDPTQTLTGFRMLERDGTPSNLVNTAFGRNQPNGAFGSGYQPIIDAVGSGTLCVSNPNLTGADYELHDGRLNESDDGTLYYMSYDQSKTYGSSKQGFQWVFIDNYEYTSSFTDFLLFDGTSSTGTAQYKCGQSSQFFTGPDQTPPDGTTGIYTLTTDTSTFLQVDGTTGGAGQELLVSIYDQASNSYQSIDKPDFLRDGECLMVSFTQAVLTAMNGNGPSVDAAVSQLGRNAVTLKNLTRDTGSITLFNNRSNGDSRPGTRVCKPMHPRTETVTECGIAVGRITFANNMSVFRLGYAVDDDAAFAIARTFTTYTTPDYCSRIP